MAQLTVRRYDCTDADRVWELHERSIRDSAIPFIEDVPEDHDLRNIKGQ